MCIDCYTCYTFTGRHRPIGSRHPTAVCLLASLKISRSVYTSVCLTAVRVSVCIGCLLPDPTITSVLTDQGTVAEPGCVSVNKEMEKVSDGSRM